MKYFKRVLIITFCFTCFNSCKEYNLDDQIPDNSFRIKTIIEYVNLGEEIRRDIFNYENNKLVLQQSYILNENDETCLIQRVEVEYNQPFMIATLFKIKNNSWQAQQTCINTVSNNQILEKTISRLANPVCENCWKYNYKYNNSKLIEWNKFLKTETDEWNKIRKGTYTYKNDRLIEYVDSVNYDNTGMKPDYKKLYIYENDILLAWVGGICIENSDWKPTQKAEYLYGQNNVTNKIYSVWDEENEEWKYFGDLKFGYDNFNNLIEETTSLGNLIVYEYEKGLGNTGLIYCYPENKEQAEPTIKSWTGNSEQIRFQ